MIYVVVARNDGKILEARLSASPYGGIMQEQARLKVNGQGGFEVELVKA